MDVISPLQPLLFVVIIIIYIIINEFLFFILEIEVDVISSLEPVASTSRCGYEVLKEPIGGMKCLILLINYGKSNMH